jgi:hypothetical protein
MRVFLSLLPVSIATVTVEVCLLSETSHDAQYVWSTRVEVVQLL